jgi:hypothetical protein
LLFFTRTMAKAKTEKASKAAKTKKIVGNVERGTQ